MDKEIRKIVDIFQSISAVPRQSKHEERISRWLIDRAAEHGLESKSDAKGNVVIAVPAASGYEKAPVVVLQGHMDMVCEKTPESDHDFGNDPIELIIDGDWIRADGTTLGADNGIAMALALAIAERTDLAHPPLELLFTVDEETGLTGATSLSSDFLTGRILINLDSEDEGVITIGCAGGRDAILQFEPEQNEHTRDYEGLEITVGGLAGGHSGVDIGKHRANANKLLARVLSSLFESCRIEIASIRGGSVRNAIPRDATAVLAVAPDDLQKSRRIVEEMQSVFIDEYRSSDKGVQVKAVPVVLDGRGVYPHEFARTFVRLLRVLPNGVREYSASIHGLVETSSNLAVIKKKGPKLEVCMSQRSSVMSQLDDVSSAIGGAAELAGAACRSENSYPTWTPDIGSNLLALAQRTYREIFSEDPAVEAIHAGLECGVIGAAYPGMDMISIGPTIQHPHSPDERVSVASIGRIWKFLLAMLMSLK